MERRKANNRNETSLEKAQTKRDRRRSLRETKNKRFQYGK